MGASDVGSGKKSFTGLGDCISKTMKGPGGFLALYTGFGVSVVGIVGYRGLQLGTFDTITGLNPWKKDKGIVGAITTFAAAQTAITMDCFKKVAAEEGMVAGLYKGFTANILRSVGGALVLVFYDRAKTYLGI